MEQKSLLPDTYPNVPRVYTHRKRTFHFGKPLSIRGQADKAYMTPDGKYLAVMFNRRIVIWSILTNMAIYKHDLHAAFWLGIKTINGTEDSKYILFQGQVGIIIQWDCKLKKAIHKFYHQALILDIVSNRTNQFWSNTQKHLYKWDLQFKTCLLKYAHTVSGFLFLYLMQNYLYSTAMGSRVYIYDDNLGPKQVMVSFDFIQKSSRIHLAFSPCYKYFAQSHQYKGDIWIGDLQTQMVIHYINGGKNPLNKIYFSIDGKFLIGQSKIETVFYDLDDFQMIASFKSPMTICTTCNRLFSGFIFEGVFYEWQSSLDFVLKYDEQVQWNIVLDFHQMK